MHDSEFEKQVQQKMQELKFAPAPAVWTRVQADLQKKKRRRPAILWFLLAGLLVGGSWILYTALPATTGQTQSASQPANIPQQQNAGAPQGKIAQKENLTTNEAVVENKTIAKLSHDKSFIEKPTTTRPVHASETSTGSPVINPPTQQPVVTSPQQTIAGNTNAAPKNNQPADKKQPAEPVQKEPAETTARSNEAPVNPAPLERGEEAKVEDKATQKDKPATEQDNKAVAMKNNKQKNAAAVKNNWQWGITAGVGISDLGRQLFKPATVADFSTGNFGSNVPGPNSPSRTPAEVSAGLAWHAGGYVARNFGKKLGVKLGLNYELYSNNIRVGSQVNSARLVNQGTDMRMVEEYFTTGNSTSYNNKYHFVSVPITLQWKMYDRARHGIVWENGVNVSRLVNSTALHFDGITGTYYKDDALFKKTQLMLSSAVLFTLKTKSKVQLYAGPHVQYGISNLVTNNAGSDRHLRYAGLKLVTGFNK
jgi:hypothetical protein